jgi:hypothetical protein
MLKTMPVRCQIYLLSSISIILLGLIYFFVLATVWLNPGSSVNLNNVPIPKTFKFRLNKAE